PGNHRRRKQAQRTLSVTFMGRGLLDCIARATHNFRPMAPSRASCGSYPKSSEARRIKVAEVLMRESQEICQTILAESSARLPRPPNRKRWEARCWCRGPKARWAEGPGTVAEWQTR